MSTIIFAALLLNVFAFLTIVLRPKLFGVKLFKPMIWNFKLSLLPLLLLVVNIIIFYILVTFSVYKELNFIGNIAVVLFILGMAFWILLLPNSGYLITELNLTHRNVDEKEVPVWYDIVSVLSFALSGIVNTLLNIVVFQLLYLILFDPDVLLRREKTILMTSAVIIILLVSIGVYLGRAIRFNSWDIVHISSFFKKLVSYFKEREHIKDFVLFVFFHTAFFIIMYLSFGIQNYFDYLEYF